MGVMDRRDMIRRARELRAHMTETEAILWSKLSRRQLGGAKFSRQVVIGTAIVDFCCRGRLIVEVDGDSHEGDSDAARDRRHEAMGYRTVRV